MPELDFTPAEYQKARTSTDTRELTNLSTHQSHYIRAQVAGNSATSIDVRRTLSFDNARGVVLWLLGNKSLTRSEFAAIFATYVQRSYCDVVHSTLAAHSLATIDELEQLRRQEKWGIDIAILNNYKNRPIAQYAELIKSYPPHPEKKFDEWSIIEALAYYRTHGIRFPSR